MFYPERLRLRNDPNKPIIAARLKGRMTLAKSRMHLPPSHSQTGPRVAGEGVTRTVHLAAEDQWALHSERIRRN